MTKIFLFGGLWFPVIVFPEIKESTSSQEEQG